MTLRGEVEHWPLARRYFHAAQEAQGAARRRLWRLQSLLQGGRVTVTEAEERFIAYLRRAEVRLIPLRRRAEEEQWEHRFDARLREMRRALREPR